MSTEKGTPYGKMASIKDAPYGKREKRPALYVRDGEKASKVVPPKTHAKVSGPILPAEHAHHMREHHKHIKAHLKHMEKHEKHMDGIMKKLGHAKRGRKAHHEK